MEKLNVIEFQSVGFFKFGMKKQQLLEQLNQPYTVKTYDFMKELDLDEDDLIKSEELIFNGLKIKTSFNLKEELEWVGFYQKSEYSPVFNDSELLNFDKKTIYSFFNNNKILEEDENTAVILDLGISIYFSDDGLIDELGFMDKPSVALYE